MCATVLKTKGNMPQMHVAATPNATPWPGLALAEVSRDTLPTAAVGAEPGTDVGADVDVGRSVMSSLPNLRHMDAVCAVRPVTIHGL